MTTKAVVLFSGGLDSMLAVRMLQQQGVEVEALNFRTPFTCCQTQASQAAYELGVRLTVAVTDDDYFEVIRKPEFGYGRGANPCVDCRIYMFHRARRLMEEMHADFVASGEILGQRPMSQKRCDLETIAVHSKLHDRLLRPLSAQLLPPTLPERQGLVDRERLGKFVGRSRKGLIALAKEYGFTTIPQPSTGCALTETGFAPKVHDLVKLAPAAQAWEFELLKIGRHIRYRPDCKVVLGRRQEENNALQRLATTSDAAGAALLEPDNFIGPVALITGQIDDEALSFAAGLIHRYGRVDEQQDPQVRVVHRGTSSRRPVRPHTEAQTAASL